jgi:predicted AAA+ superfamily ATPase
MRLLAMQIGSEVSYGELSTQLGIANQTVQRYVDLLEKAFIIVRVNQFKRNQRVEVGRLRKVFFTDLGIRNSVINNFNPIENRTDAGQLWENFNFIERMKHLTKNNRSVQSYFWRNNDQNEINLIEDENSTLRAYEFKFKNNKRVKIPKSFVEQYPELESFNVVNKENFIKKILD